MLVVAVVLAIGLASLGLLAILAIALIRHLKILGGSLRRFQEEVQPIAEDIAAEGERASSRAGGLPTGKPR